MASEPSPKPQAERFKELAREVGADPSMAEFDKAVRRVAKAPASSRQPIKKQPKDK